jgi:hypothetical protein
MLRISINHIFHFYVPYAPLLQGSPYVHNIRPVQADLPKVSLREPLGTISFLAGLWNWLHGTIGNGHVLCHLSQGLGDSGPLVGTCIP